jgi:DNA transformation protein
MAKTRTLAEMRNLGVASARMLAEIGVTSPEILAELGALATYRRLRFRFGKRATTNFLYALQGALADIDWRDLPSDELARLKEAAARVVREGSENG